MSSLTYDLKQNRGFFSRYKGFIYAAAIFLLIGVNVVVGFYLFDRAENGKGAAAAPAPLPASWLIRYFGTDNIDDPKIGGAYGDPDDDILTNLQEFYFGTDPTNADTDGDGQIDGAEVAFNQNPLGEGELYSTDYSKSVSDRYLEDQRLHQYTSENIQARVMGLLNPPADSELVIDLPSASQINISSDDSPEAIKNYLRIVADASEELGLTPTNVIEKLSDRTFKDALVFHGAVYEMIDRYRSMQVPVPFLNLHQLQLAGLLATAKLLDATAEYDNYTAIESQTGTVSRQYYQISLIQKIDQLISEERQRLGERYEGLFQELEDIESEDIQN